MSSFQWFTNRVRSNCSIKSQSYTLILRQIKSLRQIDQNEIVRNNSKEFGHVWFLPTSNTAIWYDTFFHMHHIYSTFFYVFLFLEADTIKEYIDSIYLITATLGILISTIHTTSKTATIFTLIDMIEKIVKKSEHKS